MSKYPLGSHQWWSCGGPPYPRIPIQKGSPGCVGSVGNSPACPVLNPVVTVKNNNNINKKIFKNLKSGRDYNCNRKWRNGQNSCVIRKHVKPHVQLGELTVVYFLVEHGRLVDVLHVQVDVLAHGVEVAVVDHARDVVVVDGLRVQQRLSVRQRCQGYLPTWSYKQMQFWIFISFKARSYYLEP